MWPHQHQYITYTGGFQAPLPTMVAYCPNVTVPNNLLHLQASAANGANDLSMRWIQYSQYNTYGNQFYSGWDGMDSKGTKDTTDETTYSNTERNRKELKTPQMKPNIPNQSFLLARNEANNGAFGIENISRRENSEFRFNSNQRISGSRIEMQTRKQMCDNSGSMDRNIGNIGNQMKSNTNVANNANLLLNKSVSADAFEMNMINNNYQNDISNEMCDMSGNQMKSIENETETKSIEKRKEKKQEKAKKKRKKHRKRKKKAKRKIGKNKDVESTLSNCNKMINLAFVCQEDSRFLAPLASNINTSLIAPLQELEHKELKKTIKARFFAQEKNSLDVYGVDSTLRDRSVENKGIQRLKGLNLKKVEIQKLKKHKHPDKNQLHCYVFYLKGLFWKASNVNAFIKEWVKNDFFMDLNNSNGDFVRQFYTKQFGGEYWNLYNFDELLTRVEKYIDDRCVIFVHFEYETDDTKKINGIVASGEMCGKQDYIVTMSCQNEKKKKTEENKEKKKEVKQIKTRLEAFVNENDWKRLENAAKSIVFETTAFLGINMKEIGAKHGLVFTEARDTVKCCFILFVW